LRCSTIDAHRRGGLQGGWKHLRSTARKCVHVASGITFFKMHIGCNTLGITQVHVAGPFVL
jgi:hypothetical protein